jgi:hypothetical protein
VTDLSYLSLVSSDQYLRTTVAGRTISACPTGAALRGRPLSEAQISDVVAWLSSGDLCPAGATVEDAR